MESRDRHWPEGYRRGGRLVRGDILTGAIGYETLAAAWSNPEQLSLPITWHDGGYMDAILDAFN